MYSVVLSAKVNKLQMPQRNPEKLLFPPAGQYRRLGDGPQELSVLQALREAHLEVDATTFHTRLGDIAMHHAAICIDIATLTRGTPEAAESLEEAETQLRAVRDYAPRSNTKAQQLYARSGMFAAFLPFYRASLVEQRPPLPDEVLDVWNKLVAIPSDPDEPQVDAGIARGAASSASRTWHEMSLHLLNLRYMYRLGHETPVQFSWSSLQRHYGSQEIGPKDSQPLPYWNIGFSAHSFLDDAPTKVHTMGGRNPHRKREYSPTIKIINMNQTISRDGSDRMLARFGIEQMLLAKRRLDYLDGIELLTLRNAQAELDIAGMNLFTQLGWHFNQEEKTEYLAHVQNAVPLSGVTPPQPLRPEI